MSLPLDRLNALVRRFEAIEAELQETQDSDRLIALSKERNELEPVATAMRARTAAIEERDALAGLLDDPQTDSEMRILAEEERAALSERIEVLEKELRLLLLPKDVADERGVILEIRAGTGGDEAALFAGDLFRMYSRFADLNGWKVDVLSESEGTAGGYKEIISSVSGQGVYARLKFESGVHRVQRVPATEAQGRIHTSAATVAVLPEAAELDVEINDADLRIDTMRAGGAGGQHVNKTESAVRVTHLPSGIAIVVQDERSQHRNKARALSLIRARLFDMERERQAKDRADARRGQVGSGDRSERIRTYNYPQGRVTDHRIGLTVYNLPEVMEGAGLAPIVEALVTEHQARLLAEEAA